MATTNYNLPTITGNMTADVVRDMNALAEATDSAIKVAVDGIDLSEIERDVRAVDARVTAHLDEKASKTAYGHVKIGDGLSVNGGIINVDDKADSRILATLNTGWTHVSIASSPLLYYKDSIGRVHLEGAVRYGGSGEAVLTTLPVGYRPERNETYSVTTNNAQSTLIVYPDGKVQCNGATTLIISISFLAVKEGLI